MNIELFHLFVSQGEDSTSHTRLQYQCTCIKSQRKFIIGEFQLESMLAVGDIKVEGEVVMRRQTTCLLDGSEYKSTADVRRCRARDPGGDHVRQ